MLCGRFGLALVHGWQGDDTQHDRQPNAQGLLSQEAVKAITT